MPASQTVTFIQSCIKSSKKLAEIKERILSLSPETVTRIITECSIPQGNVNWGERRRIVHFIADERDRLKQASQPPPTIQKLSSIRPVTPPAPSIRPVTPPAPSIRPVTPPIRLKLTLPSPTPEDPTIVNELYQVVEEKNKEITRLLAMIHNQQKELIERPHLPPVPRQVSPRNTNPDGPLIPTKTLHYVSQLDMEQCIESALTQISPHRSDARYIDRRRIHALQILETASREISLIPEKNPALSSIGNMENLKQDILDALMKMRNKIGEQFKCHDILA